MKTLHPEISSADGRCDNVGSGPCIEVRGNTEFTLFPSVQTAGSNSFGQLGISGPSARDSFDIVQLPARIKKVVAGGEHNLALTMDGHVWSWGNNSKGQLGNAGSQSMRAVPQRIAGLPGIRDIAAGLTGRLTGALSGSNFGTSLALDSLGNVYQWGMDIQIPTQVAIPPAREIASGRQHYLALDIHGKVWAWGRHNTGQLGVGTPVDTEYRFTPAMVKAPTGTGTLDEVVSIGAGENNGYAIQQDGTVWAWGTNVSGELGIPQSIIVNYTSLPIQISSLNGVNIRQIVGGEDHALAIDGTGNLWAWGSNQQGELGIDKSSPRELPKIIPNLRQFRSISAGAGISAACDIQGELWAWGSNSHGQLGLGSPWNAYTPKRVAGGCRSVGAGNRHIITVK